MSKSYFVYISDDTETRIGTWGPYPNLGAARQYIKDGQLLDDLFDISNRSYEVEVEDDEAA